MTIYAFFKPCHLEQLHKGYKGSPKWWWFLRNLLCLTIVFGTVSLVRIHRADGVCPAFPLDETCVLALERHPHKIPRLLDYTHRNVCPSCLLLYEFIYNLYKYQGIHIIPIRTGSMILSPLGISTFIQTEVSYVPVFGHVLRTSPSLVLLQSSQASLLGCDPVAMWLLTILHQVIDGILTNLYIYICMYIFPTNLLFLDHVLSGMHPPSNG